MELKTLELGPVTRRIVGWIVFCLFTLTLASMVMDHKRTREERDRVQALEMSKRGYCLKATAGTDQLTYQPCGVTKEY